MMKVLRLIFVGLLIILLGGPLTQTLAKPPAPHTPPHPPLPPSSASETSAEAPAIAQSLPPLKAVLLVGPIDGDSGDWTESEKDNMDLTAAELQANGVEVHKFYPPDNDWEQIKAAADGAHFLFYRGHGVYWSSMPYPTVGGFHLKNKFVSSDDIRDNLHLAPNAIVMLYGCFTAGSSSSDGGPISSQEAQRRVVQYSDPFSDLGAAGYYANWFGNAFQMFVRYLFQGMTLGEAYEAYFDFNPTTVERHTHPDHPDMALWLDQDNWGHWQYNNAFVGLSDHTLSDLFQPAEMTLTPTTITYLAEPDFSARSFAFRVDSAGSDTFTWTASVSHASASWLDLDALSGSSGNQVTVTLTPAGQAVGTHEAQIHVAAETSGIENSEQDITVTLLIADQVHTTCLPLVVRGSH